MADSEVVSDHETGESTVEGGKPPRLFSLDPAGGYLIGLHYSGKHFFGSLIDLQLRVLTTVAQPVPAEIRARELVDLLEQMIRRLIKSAPVDGGRCLGIGVGTPGVTDLGLGEVVFSPHHPGIGEHLALRDLVAERLDRSAPVFVDNSIRFRTIAEQTMGHLRGIRDGAVIYCDDGLISGLLLDGRIRRGPNSLAGSIGHMTINPADPFQCACGGYGCWEMQVSPDRLVDEMRLRLLQRTPSPARVADNIASVMDLADQGDPDAVELIDQVAHWFAVGIHNMILAYDPEVVVVQGVYARQDSRFFRSLTDQIGGISLLRAPFQTQVVCSSLGSDAANLGAASYSLSMALA
ncbi:MAG TPA: ROK family protein [Alkalispirochaeta sp.]|nr:ROK family protein [Alkalispirochaeta sp.]